MIRLLQMALVASLVLSLGCDGKSTTPAKDANVAPKDAPRKIPSPPPPPPPPPVPNK